MPTAAYQRHGPPGQLWVRSAEFQHSYVSDQTVAAVSWLQHGTFKPGVLLWLRRGSDDEVDETPIESTADTELYKLTLPMDITAAPQVWSSSPTQPAVTTMQVVDLACGALVLYIQATACTVAPLQWVPNIASVYIISLSVCTALKVR